MGGPMIRTFWYAIICLFFTTSINSAVIHQIGDYYGGGIIYYVNPNPAQGNHGLIAAVEDATKKPVMIYIKTTNTPSTQRDLFTGYSNTEQMLLAAKNAHTLAPAASAAHNYTTKDSCPTCSPWYLPSRAELRMLFRQKVMINSELKAHGGQPLGNLNYWSSSQIGSRFAWGLNFDDSEVDANAKPIRGELYVRAVRAF
jgi:hypothetical protein